MRIHNGSTNPVKIAAVQLVLWDYAKIFSRSCYYSEDVDSEIGNQPMNWEEIRLGSENRAKNCFEIGGKKAIYSFWVEDGVIILPDGKNLMNTTICTVWDGSRIIGFGEGSRFMLPSAVSRLILQEDNTLEEAVARTGISSDKYLGRNGGIISVLSNKFETGLNRTKTAVRNAILPLVHPEWYQKEF